MAFKLYIYVFPTPFIYITIDDSSMISFVSIFGYIYNF